jgi:hypothetical protein
MLTATMLLSSGCVTIMAGPAPIAVSN